MFYLLLRCTGALQGSPRNLLGFKGAVGGSLFTAISHGRIGDVVQTSHTLGKEMVQWRHLYVASDCLNPEKKHKFKKLAFFVSIDQQWKQV